MSLMAAGQQMRPIPPELRLIDGDAERGIGDIGVLRSARDAIRQGTRKEG